MKKELFIFLAFLMPLSLFSQAAISPIRIPVYGAASDSIYVYNSSFREFVKSRFLVDINGVSGNNVYFGINEAKTGFELFQIWQRSGNNVTYNPNTTGYGVGVGTSSPARTLHVQDATNAYLRVQGSNNAGVELYIHNSNPVAQWATYTSRGSSTTPTSVSPGNALGQFTFYGYDGATYRTSGYINIVCAGTVSTNVVPSYMVFGVNRNGFGAPAERMRITQRGRIGIGTTTPSGFLTVGSDEGTNVLTLKSNANDSTTVYIRPTAPEGSQSAPVNSISIAAGVIHIKNSGTSNTGWQELDRVLKASATLDFPSTANNTNSDLTVTVTGAAVGDAVSVGLPTAAISNHSCYTAWVSSANTVTVRFNHYGAAGPTDPASGTFNVIVHKY
jgi:uncharacterized protein (UPF0333 family)